MGDTAYIYLEDGTSFQGDAFGYNTVKCGELIFTTSMNGYPESLSDPSYAGQIMIITHPLVGNYGVPKRSSDDGILLNFESEKVQVDGLIVSELTKSEKWNCALNLDEWLANQNTPGISGLDTRLLTKKVRDKGAMMCAISTRGRLRYPERVLKKDYTKINFVEQLSPKRPIVQNRYRKSVVVVDCGVKHGILRNVSRLGYNVIRVPYNYTADKIMSFNPAGVLYSNGPGNPNLLKEVVSSMQTVLEYKIPVFGICLGHQIASLALGGRVRKMKFGHRAVNKAVVDQISGKAYITSHNHGYAMTPRDMPDEGKIWLMSPDDNIVEGALYKKRNMMTTQFHPEGRPGTNDAGFIFGMFGKMIKENGN